ncbi:hypothetical protein G7Z17_g13141 [Cylindrodendrum hubeiense]|uniref:Acyltransferase 3 domain-containing protein n=1 Tax=Cylindrodendrum hubeiense TaxID=595255 RepID=A0A9P5GU65_9HYPO|nr:hypothetical protein G7Z17_g13141 [Cylindrodendrum hubeiense]
MSSRRNSNLNEERAGILDDITNATLDQGLHFPTGWTKGIYSFDGWPYWRLLIRQFARFLVPSFLQGQHMRDQIWPAELGPTAYLDGMRGIACLMVYLCHFTAPSYGIGHGWGHEGNRDFMRLPFVRLLYAGGSAVSVFFIISGYALSYKPIQHIRNRKLGDFCNVMCSMAFRRVYGGQLWTIAVEFRSSFYLFGVILTTARLRTRYRFLTVMTVAYISYRACRSDMILFLMGMLLVENDHIRGAHVPAVIGDEKHKPTQSRLETVFWHLLGILALFLLSMPERSDDTPGWVYLTSRIPKWWRKDSKAIWYWNTVGATFFLLTVTHSPWWQRVFNSAIAQYLGKISFSLYLVHNIVFQVIGQHLQKLVWDITGVEGNAYPVGFVLGGLLCLAVNICVADVFWRAVDTPVVKFARWVESKAIVKSH